MARYDLPFWTAEDEPLLDQVEAFPAMLSLAHRILDRIPHPVGMVCGPVSSGGLGSIEKNLKALAENVRILSRCGHPLFCQIPFEEPIQRIRKVMPSAEFAPTLLSRFFQPLFEQRRIEKLFFVAGWTSSSGSRWEHEQALRLGLERCYLDGEGKIIPEASVRP